MITYQDNTIRDGMQQRGVKKNLRTKQAVAGQIARFKEITSVEVGMCSCKEDIKMVSAITACLAPWQEPAILTRLCEKDICLAAEAGKSIGNLTVKLLVPISRLHVETKLGISMEELLRSLQGALELLKQRKLKMEVCLEDVTRAVPSDISGVLDMCSRYPITYISICDTVGCMVPAEFGNLVKDIASRNPKFGISIHCHNDMGLATANTLEGIRNGAVRAETTLLGIGERAGNASFEEIAFIRHKKYRDFTKPATIYEASKRVGELLQYPIPENKPLLGENAYIHESGIHQDGIRKDRKMYQYVCPEEFGRKQDEIVQPVSGISSAQAIRTKIEGTVGGKKEDVGRIMKLYRSLSKIIDKITVEEACDLYFYGEGMNCENN